MKIVLFSKLVGSDQSDECYYPYQLSIYRWLRLDILDQELHFLRKYVALASTESVFNRLISITVFHPQFKLLGFL